MTGVGDPSVVVLFVILGAGALVCLAYAASRHFAPQHEDEEANAFRMKRDQQVDYMRQVRLQNLGWCEMEASAPRSPGVYAAAKGLATTIEDRYEMPNEKVGPAQVAQVPPQKGKQSGRT